MRILLLSQWYLPEPAYNIHELAQTLAEHGHDVTVLTGFPNYPTGKIYSGYRIYPWQKEKFDDVQVVRVPLFPEHSQSGLLRACNYISLAISISLLGFWLVPKPDIMFVYHPPLTLGIPAWILSRLWRIPFVFQIQDMWPETLAATGMLNNSMILEGIQRFANLIYRKANLIFVISPGFRRNLLSKNVPDEKIRVVSNWVDTEFYYPAQRDEQLAKALGLDGYFNIMFAGNIGEAQGLDTVIEAAKRLTDLPKIQFVIIGDGTARSALEQLKTEYQLNNILFLGRYVGEKMSTLYALADVLLIHLKDDPLFRMTIPHKTFAYMASGKPIIAALSGDAADVVISAGCGLTCNSEDPVAMADLVRQFYEMPIEDREALGQIARDMVCTSYNREALISQIENSLCNIVDTSV